MSSSPEFGDCAGELQNTQRNREQPGLRLSMRQETTQFAFNDKTSSATELRATVCDQEIPKKSKSITPSARKDTQWFGNYLIGKYALL